jgi:ANTAR domain/PAS fold
VRGPSNVALEAACETKLSARRCDWSIPPHEPHASQEKASRTADFASTVVGVVSYGFSFLGRVAADLFAYRLARPSLRLTVGARSGIIRKRSFQSGFNMLRLVTVSSGMRSHVQAQIITDQRPEYVEMVRDEPRLRPDRWPRVGGFRYLVRDDRWEWSDEVARMHGYAPGTVTPTTELVLAHRHPEDKPTVGDLIVQVYRQGSPVTCRHRIIDTRGNEHVVLVVGDSFREDGGEPAGITGFYIEITEQFNKDMQERLSEAVQTITERRAVINQAIGMLMLRYGIDADLAFKLLTRLSQESNIKLRVIAERAAADPATLSGLVENLADRIGTLFRSVTKRRN